MAEVRLDILINTLGDEKVQRLTGQVEKLSLAILAVGAASVRMAMQFDTSMRKVSTIFGEAETAARGFGDEIQRMARERGRDANDLANALYQIGSAGVSSADALKVLDVAAAGAVGGFTDTETAADGLVKAMNAWRMETSRAEYVMDVFVRTQDKGIVTVGDLASRIGTIAPLASAMGVSLEEVAAAIATTTASGIPFEQAITGLRQVLVSIAKPSAEAAELADKLKIAFSTEGLEGHTLQEFLESTAKAAQYSTSDLAVLLGSVEALTPALALVGQNADTAAQHLKDMGEASGATRKNQALMEAGTQAEWDRMVQEVKNLGTEIGEGLTPAVKDLVDSLEPITAWFTDFAKKEPEWVAAIVKIAAGMLLLAGAARTLQLVKSIPAVLGLAGAGAGAAAGAAGAEAAGAGAAGAAAAGGAAAGAAGAGANAYQAGRWFGAWRMAVGRAGILRGSAMTWKAAQMAGKGVGYTGIAAGSSNMLGPVAWMLTAGEQGFKVGAGRTGMEYLYGGTDNANGITAQFESGREADRMWQYRRFVESFMKRYGRNPSIMEIPPMLLTPGQRRWVRGLRQQSNGASTSSEGEGGLSSIGYQPFSSLPTHTQNLWRGYGDFAAQHATAEWARTKEGEYKVTEGKYEVTIRIDPLLAKNPDLVNALAAQPAFRDAVVDVIVETERQPRQRY